MTYTVKFRPAGARYVPDSLVVWALNNMGISPEVMGVVIGGLSVPYILYLLSKIRGLRHTPNLKIDFLTLNKQYAKWGLFSVIPLIVFFSAIALTLPIMLIFVADFRVSAFKESIITIPPPYVLWGLPAVFMGFVGSFVLLHYLYKRLLGPERYVEFIEYGNQMNGIDFWKTGKLMAGVIIPICIVFSLLALDTYAYVTRDGFVENRFLGLGETVHQWDEIAEIELVKSFKVPNGNIIRKKYFVIHFSDGSVYKFHPTLDGFNYHDQRRLIEFIQNNRPLDVRETDPFPISEIRD